MKHALKRILSFALALAMVLSMVSGIATTASAAGTLSTINGLTASWTDATSSKGSASWSASGTGITGTATGYKNIINRTVSTTLTLTNSSGGEATLKFSYTLTNGGSVSGAISGTSGTYEQVLASGASITITLKSPNGATSNTLNITGLSLISTSASDVTTTFKTGANGSYTLGGADVTTETTKTEAAGTEYALVATPASGYVFFGWYDEISGEYLSYDATYTHTAAANAAIVPKFVSSTTALFGVGAAKFFDLTEAGAYAAAGSNKTIILLNNGTVSGSHTIPASTTLLIPFDAGNTLYTTEPAHTNNNLLDTASWVKPTAYRTLTLAANANITVNGSISISAKHYAQGGGIGSGAGGAPTESVGFVKMNSGSKITLNSGANLYAWGYITGSGSIDALSGSKIYENFQIKDFRGGGATTSMANDGIVFPLSQYYVQNIEVPTNYHYGAEEHVYTSLYISGSSYSAGVKFIGDGAMFQPQSGAVLTKDYIESTDRLNLTVSGDAALANMSLSLAGTEIDSSTFILPITNNITININSGTTTLQQDVALLPGVELNIASGATLDLASGTGSGTISDGTGYNVFVYDLDEWRSGYNTETFDPDNIEGSEKSTGLKFVHQSYEYIALNYVPGRTGTRAALKDAVIDVNGTIVTNGFMYTTESGASIISSGETGKVVMKNGAGAEAWTYQAGQNDTTPVYYAILCNTAALKNGDGSYTETADAVAGDAYVYNADTNKWEKVTDATITFDGNGGSAADNVTTTTQTVSKDDILAGNKTTLNTNAFTREGYKFLGWNTDKNATTALYANKAEVAITTDTTLYAIWQVEKYFIYIEDDYLDGDDTAPAYDDGDVELAYGTTITDEMLGTPTKDGYTFTGWLVSNGVDGIEQPTKMPAFNVYYLAQWEKAAVKYTLTFLNENGEVLAKHEYEEGTSVTSTYPNYTKANYTITWSATIPTTLTANVEISAIATPNEYTITFHDGTTELGEATANKDNNWTATIIGNPTKSDDQYNYTFLGWATTANATAADTNYKAGDKVALTDDDDLYAVWSKELKTFNVTWVDEEGEEIASESVEYGGSIAAESIPTVPAKAGNTGVWSETPTNVTSDMTIKPVYTPITYTITLDANGGTFADGKTTYTTSGDYGNAPEYPTVNPTREGWNFIGWTDAEGNKITTLPTSFDSNKTYYASWEQIKVSVSYESNGGSAVTGSTVNYGETVTIAAGPTKEGYTFAGWSVNNDKTADAEYAVDTQITLKADLKLYAIWTANEYTITFANTGDSVMENKTVAYGDAIGTIADPTKTGYTFASWTITDADGNAVTIVDGKMPAKNLTYTANWAINTYTITWNVEGVTSTTIVNHGDTPAYDKGTPTKAETAQYTYDFAGWTPEVKAAAGDATYTAQFTPMLRSYDITFMVDGEVYKTVSVNYGEKPTVAAPEKGTDAYCSYTFAGWKNSEGTVVETLPEVTGPATYTATWTETPVEHTITFVIDGETFHVVKGGYGTAVDYSDMPSTSKTGYTWNGWDQELPETIPAEDITITGSYTVNQYTITFKGDFSTDKDDAFTDYTITKNYGEAITEADITSLNAALPTIRGWEFLGWYSAEEVKYEELDEPVLEHTSKYEIPETMGAQNVTVYAHWWPISYELTVLSSIDSKKIAIQSMYYEEVYENVDEFNFVNNFYYDNSGVEDGYENLLPEGYTFAGYKYKDGTDMTFPINCWPDKEVTIVAQFKPIDYTITFMSEGAEVGTVTAGYATDITEKVAAITATKEGYVFAGWVDADGNAVTLTTMPLNGMTVYASWTVDTFTVNFFATEGDTTAVATFDVTYGTDLLTATEDDPETEEDESVPSYLAGLLAQVTDPSKTGHTWTGWDTTNVPATMPAEAVNIYGTWNINSYNILWTVVENVDDEVVATFTETFQYGAAVTAPDYTAPKGYKIAGIEEYPATMPAENLDLQITITPETYTITFDTDGGEPATIPSITAAYGTAITWPAAPTKVGHTFQGWSTDGVTVITLPETMPAENLNLKAVWAKNTVYIDWIIDGVKTTQEYKYGDTITAPEATKAADEKWTYKFTGWDAEIPATATANATYTAQFEQDQAVKYTVKFVNGENTVYETEIAWNDEVTLDGVDVTVQEGHTLTWTVDGTAVEFPYPMTIKAVTFVANWTPNTYTITADGVEYRFIYGDEVSIADPAAKEGHTFKGWLKDGVAYELPATMPAENIVITSDWTVNTYTLTVSSFDADGKGIEETYTVEYGAKLADYYLATPSYTDPDGMLYEFQNWIAWTWQNNDDATMVEYEGATMPASDVKMYTTYTMTGWYTDEGGTTYLVKSEKVYFGEWAEIDGVDYWFDANSYIAKDITLIDGSYYAFNHDTGAFLSTTTGIYTASNGDLYYVVNGVAVKNNGLVQVDDPAVEGGHLYYYFGCGATDCSAEPCLGEYVAQKSNRHYAAITNGYLIEGGFTTGEDGIIEHIDDTTYEGIYVIDGVKYYLMDGVKVHKGLIYVDGYYYYARSSGALAVNQTYWVSGSKLNGLGLKAGTYQFDEEGRIVFSTKEGFYYENDAWYYYEDGKLFYAGLIYLDGTDGGNEDWQCGPTEGRPGYYYVNSSCMLVTDRAYWISKNNGLMKNKTYYFNEYGTMYEPVVDLKEGFYYENDAWYYYEDGKLCYAGLIYLEEGPINGEAGYYYVNSKGMLITDRAYWISKNNGLMKNKTYYFNEYGTMYEPVVEAKEGFYYENDAWYYYENGELCYAGLIYLEEGPINGEAGYYYVNSAGKLITGRDYWISKGNGLMKNRSYNFDENGIMTNPQPYAN